MSNPGTDVTRRLAANPAVVRAPTDALDLFLHHEFASEDECRHLIALVDADRRPSRLFADHPDREFRTSDTCNLDPGDAVVQRLDERISGLLGLEPKHGEYLQGQKYAEGQQYKPHHDFLREDQPYWPRQAQLGGQRTWTAMVYLNDTVEGGETCFREARIAIRPRTGTLLTWNNCLEDGAPNRATLHQGMPVIRGEKYIVTKWFRQRPWGPPRTSPPIP